MLPRWARKVILTVLLTEVIRFLLHGLFTHQEPFQATRLMSLGLTQQLPSAHF
jgi:hypothetical protein